MHSQKSLCHYLRPRLQGPSLCEGTAHAHVAHFARSSVMGQVGKLGLMEPRSPACKTETAPDSAPLSRAMPGLLLEDSWQCRGTAYSSRNWLHPLPHPLPPSTAGAWPEDQPCFLVSFWTNFSALHTSHCFPIPTGRRPYLLMGDEEEKPPQTALFNH